MEQKCLTLCTSFLCDGLVSTCSSEISIARNHISLKPYDLEEFPVH
jgi:hypothetical protein